MGSPWSDLIVHIIILSCHPRESQQFDNILIQVWSDSSSHPGGYWAAWEGSQPWSSSETSLVNSLRHVLGLLFGDNWPCWRQKWNVGWWPSWVFLTLTSHSNKTLVNYQTLEVMSRFPSKLSHEISARPAWWRLPGRRFIFQNVPILFPINVFSDNKWGMLVFVVGWAHVNYSSDINGSFNCLDWAELWLVRPSHVTRILSSDWLRASSGMTWSGLLVN